jgi:hypothetical protein
VPRDRLIPSCRSTQNRVAPRRIVVREKCKWREVQVEGGASGGRCKWRDVQVEGRASGGRCKSDVKMFQRRGGVQQGEECASELQGERCHAGETLAKTRVLCGLTLPNGTRVADDCWCANEPNRNR